MSLTVKNSFISRDIFRSATMAARSCLCCCSPPKDQLGRVDMVASNEDVLQWIR